MEFVLLSFLLICTSATISAADPTFCTKNGVVMTPLGDCTHFDMSAGDQIPSAPQDVVACPAGLLFDTTQCVCNWPCNVACGAIYPYIEPGFVPVTHSVKLGPLMKVGNTIKVTGTPTANANYVSINLCKNDGCSGYMSLHFDIRINKGGYTNHVIMNDYPGYWNVGAEVRSSSFPFRRGQQFTLSIKMLADKYKMTATSSGNTNEYQFTYRQLPLEDFTLLQVEGNMPTVKIEVTDD